MGQVIKRFSDGSFLEYDKGSFDNWCVYLTRPDGSRTPPRDRDYFSALKSLADKYGAGRVYGDYVRVYDLTGKQIEASTLKTITDIAAGYGSDSLKVDLLFTVLYMAMIAEERKTNTRLGKRIKRLGIHCLLMENQPVEQSANFMRSMKWTDIAALCERRGF